MSNEDIKKALIEVLQKEKGVMKIDKLASEGIKMTGSLLKACKLINELKVSNQIVVQGSSMRLA
jgi:uncharacterized protein YccT (UPF0319 family)